MTRRYSELKKLKTFEERFDYLNLEGLVCNETFGFDRYLNQKFYKSPKWLQTRDHVIVRDEACDLGIEGRDIYAYLTVHHINPITIDDIIDGNPDIYNPEFLITTSYNTHQAVHFGNKKMLSSDPIERTKNDTIPWKR